MEEGFIKGQSDNLPRIDAICMFAYRWNNPDFVSAETKGVKTQKSARETYGDNAVGCVQLKRQGDICTVKGRITPEHKVTKKPYSVTLVYDELQEEIKSVQCEDCAASLGGCKHAVAFLAWVHRRTEEPSPTSVECYWKRSVLSSIATSLKFIKVSDMSKKRPICNIRTDNFLQEVVEEGRKRGRTDTMLGKYFRSDSNTQKLSIHKLIRLFIKSGKKTCDEFIEFCHAEMTAESCQEAEAETRDQSTAALWHELRYGRITASKAYEASRCSTLDGSLVETVFGATIKETLAMKRGKDLEVKVRKVVIKKTGIRFKPCGIQLSEKDPRLGASADGISDDYVLEIKCPSHAKTVKNYINNDSLTPKCNSQIQLQMYLYMKSKGIFCVADPEFELSSEVKIIQVDRDDKYIEEMISKCNEFWNRAIFPVLIS